MTDLPLDPKALEKALRSVDFAVDGKTRRMASRMIRAYLEAAPQPAAGDALPAYQPQVIRYDEGGFYEFVTADVPTVIRDMDDYSLVLDLETRKPIGVRWPARPAGNGHMIAIRGALAIVALHQHADDSDEIAERTGRIYNDIAAFLPDSSPEGGA